MTDDLPFNLRAGDFVLCDFDPLLGKIYNWDRNDEQSRIIAFPKENIIRRLKICLLKRENDGKRLCSFDRSYLHCKIRSFSLTGHLRHRRSGTLYVSEWYKTIPTINNGRHLTPEGDVDIYAIIIDGVLVYRPFEYQEISPQLPELAGPVTEANRCLI